MLKEYPWQYKGFWSTVIVFLTVLALVGYSKPSPSHSFENRKQAEMAQQMYLENQ